MSSYSQETLLAFLNGSEDLQYLLLLKSFLYFCEDEKLNKFEIDQQFLNMFSENPLAHITKFANLFEFQKYIPGANPIKIRSLFLHHPKV